MAAIATPIPGAHERRVAERSRSARLIRESISLLSSKWSVDILLALGDGTRRYHELLEDLQPISEKVLTQTLRGMERGKPDIGALPLGSAAFRAGRTREP